MEDKINTCFQVGLMWLSDAVGEMYAHLPFSGKSANDLGICVSNGGHGVSGSSCPNPTDPQAYGIGLAQFDLAAGSRTTLTQRIRLNDANNSNGQIELYVNGTSKFVADNLVIRASDEGRIWGLQMRTFFGRGTWTLASLHDRHRARLGRGKKLMRFLRQWEL